MCFSSWGAFGQSLLTARVLEILIKLSFLAGVRSWGLWTALPITREKIFALDLSHLAGLNGFILINIINKTIYKGWGENTDPCFQPVGLMHTGRVTGIICRHLQMCWVTLLQLHEDLPAPSKHGPGAGNAFGNRVQAAEVVGLLLKIMREI